MGALGLRNLGTNNMMAKMCPENKPKRVVTFFALDGDPEISIVPKDKDEWLGESSLPCQEMFAPLKNASSY